MNDSPPQRVYKFLPSEYIEPVYRQGQLLFRNLTYFRQFEDKTRGDHLEGHHRDNPDNNIQITNLRTGTTQSGDYSFLNTTDTDEIFVYCLATRLDASLYAAFQSDACIEITDVPTFEKRTRIAIAKLASKHRKGLLCGPVAYYAPNKPSNVDIKDPTKLAFLKDQIYSHQSEYRLVFGTRKAFRLQQKLVVNKGYDSRAEALKGSPKSKTIKVGSLGAIATVHLRP